VTRVADFARAASVVPAGPSAFDAHDPPSTDGLRACVHCGICLPECPTFRVLGEEMDSPRGRVYLMRAASEGRTALTPTFARHLDLCLGCRACETACPSGVPFGQLLEAARGQLARQRVRAPDTNHRALAWALRVFPYPARLGRLLGLLRVYQRSGLQTLVRSLGVLRRSPRLASIEALLPEVPSPARPLPAFTPARGARRGRAGLLIGCVQRHLYPDVNAATVRLLSAAGWDVVVPREQGCCGALHLHAGRLATFRAMARRLIGAFGSDVDIVVVNAAGCGSAMKEYDHWLDDPAARDFARGVRDISEVLIDSDLPLRPTSARVAYHDACHLAHGQRIRTEPRELLRRIPGLTLVDLKDAALCCGSAGVYNLMEPEVAGELGRRKADRIKETGASIVAAGNPGCLMQIAQHCRALGVRVEVTHPVTLLARALDDPRAGTPR
jgi:glycolate oxidase iron-sulfur subunit